jgi:hypothetical protein
VAVTEQRYEAVAASPISTKGTLLECYKQQAPDGLSDTWDLRHPAGVKVSSRTADGSVTVAGASASSGPTVGWCDFDGG